jgi:hypothetical protein
MVAFVSFSRIFLLGILIFKWLTARRLYKSFGVKGLSTKDGTTTLRHTGHVTTHYMIYHPFDLYFK